VFNRYKINDVVLEEVSTSQKTWSPVFDFLLLNLIGKSSSSPLVSESSLTAKLLDEVFATIVSSSFEVYPFEIMDYWRREP